MKTWMLPWLFPLGLLATVVFFTVLGRYAGLVAISIALVLAPVLWRVNIPTSGEDTDTHYWRFKRR